MFTMYGDYLHMMWLLHNIKTMQIYKFTHNPVLLYLFTNLTECQGGLLLTGMINYQVLFDNLEQYRVKITHRCTLKTYEILNTIK